MVKHLLYKNPLNPASIAGQKPLFSTTTDN